LSKRANFGQNFSFTVPTGPLRCFAMMISVSSPRSSFGISGALSSLLISSRDFVAASSLRL
jgi:hypothetical protein